MAAQICEYCKHKHEDCYCSPNSTCSKYESNTTALSFKPKIADGSKITIGEKLNCITIYNVDQHFNWFQKLMWKWCFGIKVEDYSEE